MARESNFSHFRSRSRTHLDDFLATVAGLSLTRVETLLRFGAVYINGKRTRESLEMVAGDIVRVHFHPKRFDSNRQIAVVYEDPELLIIDKPFGLPTHPTLDNYLENAWFLTQKQTGQPLFVTHRLDIATEGLLILVKSKEAQAAINRLFENRRVKKIYRTITEKPVPLGRHAHFIQLEPKPPKPVSLDATENSCTAVLTVTSGWETPFGPGCELELETGRTHQIRAQLSFLGCPILGDTVYGSNKKFVHERLALECFHISFTHRSRTIGISRPTSLVAPHSTKDSLVSAKTYGFP